MAKTMAKMIVLTDFKGYKVPMATDKFIENLFKPHSQKRHGTQVQ